MREITKWIGCAVIAAALFAVPILAACSFCLGWNGLFKLLLIGLCSEQYLLVVSFVYDANE